MTIQWKPVEQYFTVVLFVLQFIQFVTVENATILDLVPSAVKRLNNATARGAGNCEGRARGLPYMIRSNK